MALVQQRPQAKAGSRAPLFNDLLAKFYRGLGDPTRLQILRHLLDGEKNVGELVKLLDTAQGRVSSHLACLRQCGFVTVRTDGRLAYYAVTDQRVAKLLALGEAMVRENAERIFACTRT